MTAKLQLTQLVPGTLYRCVGINRNDRGWAIGAVVMGWQGPWPGRPENTPCITLFSPEDDVEIGFGWRAIKQAEFIELGEVELGEEEQ